MKTRHTPLSVLIISVLLAPMMLKAQSVTIGTIPASQFCAGDSISVTFNATGSFGHKNAFTLQLSDATGSFQTNFRNIGSAKDSLSGSHVLTALIPDDVPASAHYRFRIISAVPFTLSVDNGSDITVNGKPDLSGLTTNPALPFTSDNVILSVSGPGTTFSWDFGPDAIPPTAIGPSTQTVVFTTGGTKTIKVVENSATGCTNSAVYNVRVFSCMPAIPKSAVVIDKDGRFGGGGATIWVNPGVTVDIGGGDEVVFAEPGSTITNGGGGSIFYLKSGASFLGGGGDNILIYADGASVSDLNNAHKCPTLDFDYTNAPPNAAHPLSVQEDLQSAQILFSPNPTVGSVNIRGVASSLFNVAVLNVLGQTVLEQKNLRSSDFALDLSKLVSGTYYVRFSSANSVVTKMLVKE